MPIFIEKYYFYQEKQTPQFFQLHTLIFQGPSFKKRGAWKDSIIFIFIIVSYMVFLLFLQHYWSNHYWITSIHHWSKLKLSWEQSYMDTIIHYLFLFQNLEIGKVKLIQSTSDLWLQILYRRTFGTLFWTEMDMVAMAFVKTLLLHFIWWIMNGCYNLPKRTFNYWQPMLAFSFQKNFLSHWLSAIVTTSEIHSNNDIVGHLPLYQMHTYMISLIAIFIFGEAPLSFLRLCCHIIF